MESNTFKYNYVDKFNIHKIKETVSKFNEEWVIDTSRQKLYKEHKDTLTYMIQDFPLRWVPGNKFSITPKYIKQEHYDELVPILEQLLLLFPGTIARIMYINLPSGKFVPMHQDGGWYLLNVRRFHIPIITNDSVIYSIAGEEKVMKEGECWEINNNNPHSVYNNGNTDRIHLVVDILPEGALSNEDKN